MNKIKKKFKLFWKFLNRPFFIFLLASTIPFGYARYTNYLKNQNEINDLKTEIEARLSKLDVSRNSNKLKNTSTFQNLSYAILMPPGKDRAIFDKYANRNLRTLAYELKTRSTKYNDIANKINDLYEDYYGVTNYMKVHNNFSDEVEKIYQTLYVKSLHEPEKIKS